MAKDNLFGMTFKHEHERSERANPVQKKNSSHKELEDWSLTGKKGVVHTEVGEVGTIQTLWGM